MRRRCARLSEARNPHASTAFDRVRVPSSKSPCGTLVRLGPRIGEKGTPSCGPSGDEKPGQVPFSWCRCQILAVDCRWGSKGPSEAAITTATGLGPRWATSRPRLAAKVTPSPQPGLGAYKGTLLGPAAKSPQTKRLGTRISD